MDSLTLTVTPSTTTDGETGYTVRIVSAGLLAAGTMRADSAILRALYKLLGISLSPAITFTAADVTFFLPAPLVAEPDTFVASLATKLEIPRIPVTPPSLPVVLTPPVSPVTPVRRPAAPVRQTPVQLRGGGAAAGDSFPPPQPDFFSLPPAEDEDDDLEVELDPDFCHCITQAGVQCSRRPVKGKSVCAQHGRKKRR